MAGDLAPEPVPSRTMDRELVDCAMRAPTRQAQADAFARIYERHQAAVLRRCSDLLHEHANVLDAAADTFEAAFLEFQRGKPPRDPDKLRAWLLTIARRRCLGYMRGLRDQGKTQRRPHVDMLLADEAVAEQLVDDDADQAGIRRRQAQVDRLVAVVVTTFDERLQRIYRLSITEGLRGKRLAEPLGVTPAEASRLANDIKHEVVDGFGALVLARDGRRFCAELARILDAAAWNGDNFTTVLRDRILQHLDNCRRCDNCPTCNERRKRLIVAYQPALFPPLIAPDLRERVMDTIRRLCATRVARSCDDRHRRRRRERKSIMLLLLLFLLVPAAVIAVAKLPLPWTQERVTASQPPPTASATPTTATTQPADLAGTWRLAPYTFSGDRVYINNGYVTSAGPSGQTWTIREVGCAGGRCAYEFLTPLSDANLPEIAALDFDFRSTSPRPTPLRLTLAPTGFAGTGRYTTECGQNVPGPGNVGGGPTGPLTETVTYTIRVVNTTAAADRTRATKLAIIATLAQNPSSRARAGGCLPGTSIWRTTATRTR